jgi:hypothetical protein
MGEKYPPGTLVDQLDPVTNMFLLGTVMDIHSLWTSLTQTVLDTIVPIPFYSTMALLTRLLSPKMLSLIPLPLGQIPPSGNQDALLHPFFPLNSHITYEYSGQYHKGYLTQLGGGSRFSDKSHVNKCKEDWGVGSCQSQK